MMRSVNKPRVTHLNITCLQLGSQQSRLYRGKMLRNKEYETNNACGISVLQQAYISVSQIVTLLFMRYRENHARNSCFYLDFRPLWVFVFSSRGSLKISRKIGSYFLKITVDTWKFLSSNSIFFRKSPAAFDMSNHFFILLKNWMRLWIKAKSKKLQVNSWAKKLKRCKI